MKSLTLIVVEPGADWPDFVCGIAPDIVALGGGALDGILLERACERAHRSGAVVQLAVLACNREADDESMHRRAFAASRLLMTAARGDSGGLVLSVSGAAHAGLRLGLIGLATTLLHAQQERRARVSVRIGDGIVWFATRTVPRSPDWIPRLVAKQRDGETFVGRDFTRRSTERAPPASTLTPCPLLAGHGTSTTRNTATLLNRGYRS
jgi:hypothetical protein